MRTLFSLGPPLGAVLVGAQVALALAYASDAVSLVAGVVATAGLLGFNALSFACEKPSSSGVLSTKGLLGAFGLLAAQSFVLGASSALGEREFRRHFFGVAVCASAHLLLLGAAMVAGYKLSRENAYAAVTQL